MKGINMNVLNEIKIRLKLTWLNFRTETIAINSIEGIPTYYGARNDFHEVYANSKISKQDAKKAVKEQMERLLRDYLSSEHALDELVKEAQERGEYD